MRSLPTRLFSPPYQEASLILEYLIPIAIFFVGFPHGAVDGVLILLAAGPKLAACSSTLPVICSLGLEQLVFGY